VTSPVIFLIFNRPDCTARTFAEIRKARPPQLLVVADGPRPHVPDDAAACARTRRVVEDGIDWPCQLHRAYSERNLGCAHRVSSGLTWAFSLVPEAIVLEDDCLPDGSFFPYCDELLARYRHDTRIGQICGTPFVLEEVACETSYIFSKYGPIWGWASWRRAWAHYDLTLGSWPDLRRRRALASVIRSPGELEWRGRLYDGLHAGPPSTWDFQWGYAKIVQSLLSIIPRQNLIRNIGFGPGATHTTEGVPSTRRLGSITFPLSHPGCVLPDTGFDERFSRACVPGLTTRAIEAIRARLRRLRGRRAKGA
jgi:hypothetical protein